MRGGTRKRGMTWTWYLGVVDPTTGRRRQLTKGGFRTKREAQAALNEAMAALRSGTFVEPSRLTLGAFLTEQWLPTVRAAVRPTTWTTYHIYAEAQVLPALGHVPLQALTAAHLNRLYADLAEHGRRDGRGGLKPKSVRHVHVLLHKALNDAVRWGLVARNVADAADPPRIPRRERGVWSTEELRAFLKATSEDRLAAMWLLFATTGMRRSELLGLPWQAVDLEAQPGRLAVVQAVVLVDQRPVVVAEAKTATSRRQLALDPFTVAALKGPPRPAARGAPGLGPSLDRHRPGLHPRGRPGAAPPARHQALRPPRAGRRPAADHPARCPPQLRDRGAGRRRTAQGRVRAARARQHVDHRQPLPARAAVDGRAHRQRHADPRRPETGHRVLCCLSAVNGTSGPQVTGGR
jgi:integrase